MVKESKTLMSNISFNKSLSRPLNTRPRIFLSLSLVLFFSLLQGGCLTPESQERVDTLLCWLRPSCLPQDGNSPSPAPSKEAVTSRRPQDANTSSPAPRPTKASPPPSLPQSPPSVSSAPQQKTVSSSTADGVPDIGRRHGDVIKHALSWFPIRNPPQRPMANPSPTLAKTTIYHDLGKRHHQIQGYSG